MSVQPEQEKPTSIRRQNRIAAMQFLYMWDVNSSDNLNESLCLFFESQDKPRDYYNFSESLIQGAIENLNTIDQNIQEHAQNWTFSRIAKTDLAILRLAIYELLFRNDIPPIVSINEAIDLAKIFSDKESKRFINGILDKVKGKLQRPLRSPNGS